MTAYYNEIDPFAAQWLRNLIAAGHIAPGVVDERSIEDVIPDELREFTQCHFFAGVGVWSLALRNAGWPDDKPVWTGSCPCQPFSAAGQGSGFADERHLWPSFFHLIEQRRPPVVFGEQVASRDANPWIDLVQTDLEAVGYGVGAVAFPSAGVGAPHTRDRLYWVADTSSQRVRAQGLGATGATAQGMCGTDGQRERLWVDAGASSTNGADRMADAERIKREERLSGLGEGNCTQGSGQAIKPSGFCVSERLADAQHHGHSGSAAHQTEQSSHRENIGLSDRGHSAPQGQPTTGPTNGLWSAADWLLCRDGKWRPVEPGTFPLVNGAASRVGRLRAYGNAINAQAAQVFIESYLSA